MDTPAGSENRRPAGPGHWGKWRGVQCKADGCDKPARCRGFCNQHYNKWLWASGHRPPSVNPRSRRNARLRRHYGIGLAEYDAMFAQQDGKCAICKQPPGENVRAHWGGKLCIDHDHTTGRIRGLLCNDCNLAVGYGKNPHILTAAARYLRNHMRRDRID